MKTYVIYINGDIICELLNYEQAWKAFGLARSFCEAVGAECDLVDCQTGEVIDSFNNTEDTGLTDADFDDYGPSDLDMGFDPYEGCYTFDC